MRFNEVLSNNELINNISDKDLLKKLIEEGENKYEPVRNTIFLLRKKLKEIEKEEYLKNRKIKYYPELKKLLEELGNEYEDVLIDIDEYMSTIDEISYFSSNKIYHILRNNKKYNNKIQERIIKFLVEVNLISPLYHYCCDRCYERIFLFEKYPTQEELEEKMEMQCECDNCFEELSPDLNCIEKSSFYKLNRKIVKF